MLISPCIEWLFAAEHPALADRIRAAKAAGLTAVEFHLWRDKPLDAVKHALDETGIRLTSFVVEPRRSLVDPAQHAEMLAAVDDSLVTSNLLGSPPLVVASGFTRADASHEEQRDAAITALRQAAARAEQAGVTLVLEPLNTRTDHPGMFLYSTTEALDIIEAVASPRLKLLYDVYHSAMMDEDMPTVLAHRMHLVEHVHFADIPGRHEPGTGTLDWPSIMRTLRGLGYDGTIGLEYKPTQPALESLAMTRAAIGL